MIKGEINFKKNGKGARKEMFVWSIRNDKNGKETRGKIVRNPAGCAGEVIDTEEKEK